MTYHADYIISNVIFVRKLKKKQTKLIASDSTDDVSEYDLLTSFDFCCFRLLTFNSVSDMLARAHTHARTHALVYFVRDMIGYSLRIKFELCFCVAESNTM